MFCTYTAKNQIENNKKEFLFKLLLSVTFPDLNIFKKNLFQFRIKTICKTREDPPPKKKSNGLSLTNFETEADIYDKPLIQLFIMIMLDDIQIFP